MKVLVVLLLMVVAQVAYGQLDVGVYGLLNKVGLSGDAPKDAAWSTRFQAGGGLYAEYGVSESIGILLGGQWEQRRSALEFTLPLPGFPQRDTTVDSAYVNTTYITIPLGVRIYSTSRHWFLGTGALVQFLQSTTIDSGGVHTDAEGALKSYDVSLYLSAAYQFHFDPFFPFIEVRYQQGLIDLIGDQSTAVFESSPVVRMSGLQLHAGVSWRLL